MPSALAQPLSSDTPADGAEANDVQAVAELAAARRRMMTEIEKRVVGQKQVIDQLLVGLFAGGHCLFVGVPGLAKTLLVGTLAELLELQFSRIQFTPDLMPSDITGTEVLEEDRGTGRRAFRFVAGPLFANLVLADEINRTPPKTQAALLQAMAERRVTAGGRTHLLPGPFLVFATQNPIEQEGTYPLPEAQLDRFMFQINVDYPSADEELQIVRTTTGQPLAPIQPVLSPDEILRLQALVLRVPVAEHVLRHAVELARRSRPDPKGATTKDTPEFINQYLAWGAGPRASQFLILAAKARAILEGRYAAEIEDVRAMARPVLQHRFILNFHAEAEGMTSGKLVDRLLESVPA
jgi:MoxR-like ATPase